MSKIWFAAFLIPAVVVGGWFGQACHSHEQVAFLERLAGQIERAQVIAPETKSAVEATVASRQCRGLSANEQHRHRMDAVIARIESGIGAKQPGRACVMDIQDLDMQDINVHELAATAMGDK